MAMAASLQVWFSEPGLRLMFVIETRPQCGGCFGVFASSAFRDCLTCGQTRCEQCRGTTAPLRQQHEHCTRCHVDGCVVDGPIESYRHAMVAIVATLSQSQEKSKESLTQKEKETLSQETLSQEGRGAITVDVATRNKDGGELEPEIRSQLSQGSSVVDIAASNTEERGDSVTGDSASRGCARGSIAFFKHSLRSSATRLASQHASHASHD